MFTFTFRMIPKSTIIVHIYILLTLYMYIKMVEIGNGKCKSTCQFQKWTFNTTYILLTLIYVPLIVQNWKKRKVKFEWACPRKLYM